MERLAVGALLTGAAALLASVAVAHVAAEAPPPPSAIDPLLIHVPAPPAAPEPIEVIEVTWGTPEPIAVTTVTWGIEDYLPDYEWAYDVERAIVEACEEFGTPCVQEPEIVRCESDGNPNAVNGHPDGRTSTRATGLAQWVASTWRTRAKKVGYTGALDERFDPVANARVMSYTVANHGTGDWSTWSGHCSAAY